jgi:hypothetical protein
MIGNIKYGNMRHDKQKRYTSTKQRSGGLLKWMY